ncbi:unnamed protein product [Strongylus vulgaris]|uniref:Uncharacterized protein n=1 Tax=Strongylus vulgaris TaxID=40348 RepID=A0A3P7KCE0_STRVU|nr:unnamed protein product [Strongylus vulgaris]
MRMVKLSLGVVYSAFKLLVSISQYVFLLWRESGVGVFQRLPVNDRHRGHSYTGLFQFATTPTLTPISRVVVASGKGTMKGVTPSSKGSSSLRRLTTGARLRPYPSQGARIEMSATSDAPTSIYDLRSRFAQCASKSLLPEVALHLPPNTEALVGITRYVTS